MKQLCFFLLITLLASCEYFSMKKTSSEAILKEELQTFNWNDVDEYPSFSSCDSLNKKENKTSCFSEVLTSHISEFLENEVIVITQDVNDTIKLNLKISDKGVLELLDVQVTDFTEQEIPNIKDLLYNSLEGLPEIFPATKRGQQVTTEFELPIIINVE